MEVSAKTNLDDCVKVGFNELITSILTSLNPKKTKKIKQIEKIRQGSLHKIESKKL